MITPLACQVDPIEKDDGEHQYARNYRIEISLSRVADFTVLARRVSGYQGWTVLIDDLGEFAVVGIWTCMNDAVSLVESFRDGASSALHRTIRPGKARIVGTVAEEEKRILRLSEKREARRLTKDRETKTSTPDLMDQIKTLILDSDEPYANLTALHAAASASMDLGHFGEGEAIDRLLSTLQECDSKGGN